MDRIETSNGGFTVDAAYLADTLGIDPDQLPGLMKEGRITSQCETGQDADAGRFRLSFFHAGRALRLTVDGQGRILGRACFDVPPPPPGQSDRAGRSTRRDPGRS